jgi:hypothetical protein
MKPDGDGSDTEQPPSKKKGTNQGEEEIKDVDLAKIL